MIVSGVPCRMGRSGEKESSLSETKKYRKFTAQQKLALARPAAGGRGAAFRGQEEQTGERELRRKIGELERALGRKTYELEIAGKALRAWE